MLHNAVIGSKPYESILVNDYSPGDARRRHEFMKQIVVPVKCVKFTYSGSKEHLVFLWKVDNYDTESQILSKNMEVSSRLRKNLPVYHTRAMRREFLSMFGKQIHGKTGFLREAYKRLTGDSSASINYTTSEVDKRISNILEMEDSDLICDLRFNNTGQPEKYEKFLEECQNYIESKLETAVDDRRHDAVTKDFDVVTHLANAFSVRDLYEQIVSKCPENTPIPSKQWLRLQFWPRNCHFKSAARYTGKLKVKFMIQSRQFRKSHEDMHYASALFRYEKEFCLRFKEHCNLLCVDDKHKVKVGEPGYPVAAAERGKSVLVAMGKRFEVSDHDFTKFSITPSVALSVKIPDSIEETFYNGEVSVFLKESVFEPSSSWRHAAEMLQVIDQTKPIVAIYSDGGPDHRVTFGSVQLSLINVFLQGDFDMVVAVRTPPCNSWKNPAERIMSVLNLGFQSVGLMRANLDQNYEKLLTSVSSMNQIRDKADSDRGKGLATYVKDSMEPVKSLLSNVIMRLKWKDNNLKCKQPATDQQIRDLAWNMTGIDDIDPLHTTQTDLKSKAKLQDFLTTHCRLRHYMFSVKKCGLASCSICKAPRLPEEVFRDLCHLPDPTPSDGEKFKSFNDVYKTNTFENFRPSLKVSMNEQTGVSSHGMPFSPSSQYAKNVEMVILCSQCDKPRVLYCKTVVKGTSRTHLQRSLSDLEYSCGSSFIDVECEDSHILKKVFVRKNLKCIDAIEIPYFSAGFEPICYHCGIDDDLQESDDDYPLCSKCKNEGKRAVKKRTRTNKSAKTN